MSSLSVTALPARTSRLATPTPGVAAPGGPAHRHHGRELQIQIDDVYSCPGHCAGCMLSAAERRLGGPDMAPAVMDRALGAVEAYAQRLGALDRLNLTFGLADHLMMPDDYLSQLMNRGARLVDRVSPRDRDHSAVFVTMALIGKPARLAARLHALAAQSAALAVPMIPVVILDPQLLHTAQFGTAYRDLILTAKSAFGRVDLSLNLSRPAAALMNPQMLVEFALANAFEEVTINWVPTDGNARHTLTRPADLVSWLLTLDRLIAAEDTLSCSYRPVIQRSIAAVLCKRDDPAVPLPVTDVVRDIVPRTIAHSLQIDPKGRLLAKFEAVGDVPHAERFGFADLGSVMEAEIATLLARHLPRTVAAVTAAHARTPACGACAVSDICAATGFHIFNRLARTYEKGAASDCPHIARALISHYVADAVDPATIDASGCTGVVVS